MINSLPINSTQVDRVSSVSSPWLRVSTESVTTQPTSNSGSSTVTQIVWATLSRKPDLLIYQLLVSGWRLSHSCSKSLTSLNFLTSYFLLVVRVNAIAAVALFQSHTSQAKNIQTKEKGIIILSSMQCMLFHFFNCRSNTMAWEWGRRYLNRWPPRGRQWLLTPHTMWHPALCKDGG